MSKYLGQGSKQLPKNYYTELSFGAFPGSESGGISTYNLAIGSTYELIGSIDETDKVSDILPSTDSILKISSLSSNDMSTNGGAYQAFVDGLDNDYNRISEVVELNGKTAVNTVNSYRRVNTFYVLKSNYSTSPLIRSSLGNIHIGWGTVNSSGVNSNPMQIIIQGDPVARSAYYTIPNETVGIINYMRFGADSNKESVEFKFAVGLFGDDDFTISLPFGVPEGFFVFQPLPPIALPPKSDIGFMAKDGVTGAMVTAGMIVELRKIEE